MITILKFFLIYRPSKDSSSPASKTRVSKMQKSCIFKGCSGVSIDLARHLHVNHGATKARASEATSLVHEILMVERGEGDALISNELESEMACYAKKMLLSGEAWQALLGSTILSHVAEGQGEEILAVLPSTEAAAASSSSSPPPPAASSSEQPGCSHWVSAENGSKRVRLMERHIKLATIPDESTKAAKSSNLLSEETDTQRWLCICSQCDKIMAYRKVRYHIKTSHKTNLSNKSRSSLVSKIENTKRLCKLSVPLRRGTKDIKRHMLYPDSFSASSEHEDVLQEVSDHITSAGLPLSSKIQHLDSACDAGIVLPVASAPAEHPEDGVVRSLGQPGLRRDESLMTKAWKVANCERFQTLFPQLFQVIEDFKVLMKSYIINDSATCMRHVKMAVTILIVYITENEKTDLSLDNIVVNFQEILSCFGRNTQNGTLKNTTRLKYMRAFRSHFVSFLYSKRHSITAHLDIHGMREEVKIPLHQVSSDTSNSRQFERLGDLKEARFIPYAHILGYESTPYVMGWRDACKELLPLVMAGDEMELNSAFEQDSLIAYSPKAGSCVDLRNLLMTLLVIHTGRRSKEIISLTNREFSSRKELRGEDGEVYFRMEAREHKTERYDQRCFILAEESVVQMMVVYERCYRPVMTACQSPNGIFFTSMSAGLQQSQVSTAMSYANLAKAMRCSFVVRAGLTVPYSFSSRYIRWSFTSVSREVGSLHSDLQDVAAIMCHSKSTADREYTVGQKATTDRQVALIRKIRKEVAAGQVGTTFVPEAPVEQLAETAPPRAPSSSSSSSESSATSSVEDLAGALSSKRFIAETGPCKVMKWLDDALFYAPKIPRKKASARPALAGASPPPPPLPPSPPPASEGITSDYSLVMSDMTVEIDHDFSDSVSSTTVTEKDEVPAHPHVPSAGAAATADLAAAATAAAAAAASSKASSTSDLVLTLESSGGSSMIMSSITVEEEIDAPPPSSTADDSTASTASPADAVAAASALVAPAATSHVAKATELGL